MKNFLKHPIIKISDDKYLSLLIVLAPLLNFLSGINFDLHAPSLPAIATYYSASIAMAKNTITVSLLGFSVGSLVFGALLDSLGRRPVILFGLLVYTAVSFLALACQHIQTLLVMRFIQGFSVSCLSIGCRTIIFDNFTGSRFKIGMLYTSLASGLGPIVAPFFGGFLQYHFGWKANFIAYGLVSFSLMIIFGLYVAESQSNRQAFSWKHLWQAYTGVLKKADFVGGMIVAGLSQIQLLLYTVVGAFLIENLLHGSAITYGNSALVIGCGYLFGTFSNRLLINYFSVRQLITFGFISLIVSVLLQAVFACFGLFNLFVLIFPIMLIGFSNGFIYINVLTTCLSLSNTAGITAAVFTFTVMMIGSMGIGVISHVHVTQLMTLAMIFAACACLQWLSFLLSFKKTVQSM